MENQPLPAGWEEGTTEFGDKYYIEYVAMYRSSDGSYSRLLLQNMLVLFQSYRPENFMA